MNAAQKILSAKTSWAALGLTGAETKEEIASAYRRLALIYHPDRPTGNADVFLRIQSAHTELIGRVGQHNAYESEEEEEAAPAGADQPKQNDRKRRQTNFDSDGMQMDEDEDDDEKDGTRAGQTAKKKKKRAKNNRDADEVIQINVKLDDLYRGTTYTHYFENGQEQPVEILPGYSTGTTIRFEGASTKFTPGKTPGDLVFIITQIVHPIFTRSRDTLCCTVELSLAEALCADCVTVRGIDGRDYTIQIPPDEIVGPGLVFQRKLVGLGMPSPRTTEIGDLLVNFSVKLPEKITDEQKTAVETLLRKWPCEAETAPGPAPSAFAQRKTGEEMKMPSSATGKRDGKKPRRRKPTAAENKRAAESGDDFFKQATAHTMPATAATTAAGPEYGGDVVVPLYLSLEDLYSGVEVPYKDGLVVKVPPGSEDGMEIAYEGRGQTGKDGNGDLVFVVRETQHDRFSRVRRDLFHVQTLPLWRALTGRPNTIKTLDGRTVTVERKDPAAAVQPNERVVIAGEGMPSARPAATGGKGNMHVGFTVAYPPKIDAETKAGLKKAFKI